jgi:hypothetical protein
VPVRRRVLRAHGKHAVVAQRPPRPPPRPIPPSLTGGPVVVDEVHGVASSHPKSVWLLGSLCSDSNTAPRCPVRSLHGRYALPCAGTGWDSVSFWWRGLIYTARASAQPPPPPRWDRAPGSNGPSGTLSTQPTPRRGQPKAVGRGPHQSRRPYTPPCLTCLLGCWAALWNVDVERGTRLAHLRRGYLPNLLGARWAPSRSQVPSNVIERAHATRLGRPLGP